MKVKSEVIVAHPCDEVWEVITDYDHLDEYMPNLKSRISGRTDAGLLVCRALQPA